MVDRPTFHESWYRVAEARPRLRASVQTYRQHFRGQPWYVIRDPASNRFFRLSEPAYHFVAMLDGRRTVAEAWDACNEAMGDASPTQGEVIQTLSQLHNSNLLQADLPTDVAGLFDRYRKRVNREVRSYASNLLFLRIPLFDPNRILNRWVGVTGWVFGPVGVMLWLALLAVAGLSLVGRGEELVSSGAALLAQENLLRWENLLVLYLCMAGIKAAHEFGHGFACKHFGRQDGSGGDVHTMGIMLLVFMPVPYVDASSSWAFRSKWKRAFVGAAGMYVELAIAAVAAIVWAYTGPGVVHAVAYNVVLIASLTTLLFNGNPLLRFDGYYILSDLLELPNLNQRGKQHLYYLVKRFLYAARRPTNPAHTPGEGVLLPTYGIASFVYRVLICVGILLFVASKAFILGAILALAAVVTWVVVPLGKWAQYLVTSPELARTRGRAVGVTAGTLGAAVLALSAIPVEEHRRTQGTVDPVDAVGVFMQQSGFLRELLPTGSAVQPGGAPLVVARNRTLLIERSELETELRIAEVELAIERTRDRAIALALQQEVESLRDQLAEMERRIDRLRIAPAIGGVWIAPDLENMAGAFVERGRKLGTVASLDDLVITAVADQRLGPRIKRAVRPGDRVELRVAGRPDLELTGTVAEISEAASEELPSRALGTRAGGDIPVRPDDREGMTAAEPLVRVKIEPAGGAAARVRLHAGQRVAVRFTLPPKPLVAQWWRTARQVFQQRFQI